MNFTAVRGRPPQTVSFADVTDESFDPFRAETQNCIYGLAPIDFDDGLRRVSDWIRPLYSSAKLPKVAEPLSNEDNAFLPFCRSPNSFGARNFATRNSFV